MKLVDDLAGASPASASFPVGTVGISGGGAGDQTVGSPEVNALVGWVQIWPAPTGGLTKQQVVAQVNRSKAPKSQPSPESECEDDRECRDYSLELKASVFGEVLGTSSRRVPRGPRGRHVAKEHPRKPRTSRGLPRRRLAVQIPFARIEHPYPHVRFDAKHPR